MPSSPKPSFHHLHFETLESTHLWCKEQRKSIAELLLIYQYVIVSATMQSQGVGRLAKPWLSQPGNITFNLNLLDPLSQDLNAYPRLIEIPCAASWAICSFLQNIGLSCFLKWPNDIMTAKGKLGGCIVERYTDHNTAWLSLGVGLNIFSPETSDNPSIDQPIDSLVNYQLIPEPRLLTQDLAKTIFDELQKLRSQPFAFQVALDNPFFGKGARIQLTYANKIIEGIVSHIDASGKLYLINNLGQTLSFTSGECSMIRRVQEGEL